MPNQLPDRPNLDHLKSQAKHLLEGYIAQDPEAQSRVALGFPNPPKDFGLQTAQTVLAREYGFMSWDALKRYVEGIEIDPAKAAIDFLWAVGPMDIVPDTAPQVDHPAVRLMCGELPDIDPVAPLGPREVAPLVYVCYSKLNRNPEYREKLAAVAAQLIASGADPNSGYIEPAYPDNAFSVLYGAAGRVNSAPLTKVLLDAGANPNDGETVYHCCEWRDHDCLRMVMDAGGNPVLGNGFNHMLDWDDFEGLEILLAPGWKPTPDVLIHALARGRTWKFVERLIEAGSDPLERDHRGFNALEMAWAAGLVDIAQKLEDRYPDALSDAAKVMKSAALHQPTSLRPETRLEDGWAVMLAAERGDVEALKILLDAGFDPEGWDPYHTDKLALHSTGWHAQPATMAMLIEAGADVNKKDPMYGGTPMGWLLHGSMHRPDDRVLACAALLLNAGLRMRTVATPDEPAYVANFGSDALREYLIRPGGIPAEPS